METFEFTCNGNKFTTVAETPSAAMAKANREFLDKQPGVSDGAWFNSTETSFRWVSGNFFD